MDLSCPGTVQNEIHQKCRETIPPSSSLFKIWIIWNRFEVIVKNVRQPMKCWANLSRFLLRFSPQDGARVILELPDYSNYTRIRNPWKFGEDRLSSFWERALNKK